MMLKDKFVQEDTLPNRRRLGPLAWVSVFISVLFLLACLLGAHALLTRNVSRFGRQPVASPTASVESATLVASGMTPTPTIGVSTAMTWTVWAVKNPMGEMIYDGPAGIKAWVFRDYQAVQKWKMDHLFERDYLIGHLSEYFTDKGLEKEKRDIEDSYEGSLKVISAPLLFQSHLPAPMDKPVFNSFSADGTQLNLSDFNGPDWKFYQTQTRKLINAKVHKGTWGYTLEYDTQAKKWKIARLTLKYDMDEDKVTYHVDMFRSVTR
jgi:hypothetical protein